MATYPHLFNFNDLRQESIIIFYYEYILQIVNPPSPYILHGESFCNPLKLIFIRTGEVVISMVGVETLQRSSHLL